MSLILHGYWRSGAAYRVRIALNLKGLSFAQVAHDLRAGEQADPAFRAINPQGMVPVLVDDGAAFWQSPAILEYLEERYPQPALLPSGAADRAFVRALAATIACDIHPLNNLRVLNALRSDFGARGDAIRAWAARWIGDGFAAIERQLDRGTGPFCLGDAPGLAECFLVPQVYSAERFGVDLAPFPRIGRIVDHCLALPAFAEAHPSRQPDADPPA